jgi:hypothetical protein
MSVNIFKQTYTIIVDGEKKEISINDKKWNKWPL